MADLLELASELARFTSHSIGCAIYQRSWANGEPGCTCGLDGLRLELAGQERLTAIIRAKMQEPIFLEMRPDMPPNWRTPTQVERGCVWAGEPSPGHTIPVRARLSPDAAPIQSGATGVYARGSAGFMGQQWDGGDVAFRPETWRRVFDVMKPGAHLVAFAATKGYHRMVCAIEDAGFEIRDMVPWLYGTGFPHSHNLDGEWDGWGTNLKPAIEPVVLAQKPISEASIAANVARWGVGAINIDACRIPVDDEQYARNCSGRRGHADNRERSMDFHMTAGTGSDIGRWPANVCHDGSPEVLAAFAGNVDEEGSTFRGDSGTAARFFYSSKATQGERIFECRECGAHRLGKLTCGHDNYRTHPTVKPIDLMRWYVEMITPPGGLVLDPFAGTGTTAAAAEATGFQSLSIEADPNHVRDIGVRLGISVDELIAAQVAATPTDHGQQRDMFL